MYKKMLVFLITGLFILALAELSFAQGCGMHGSQQQMAQAEHSGHTQVETGTTQAVSKAVDAGNKICPVSGEKIEEKTKATYEYEGKVYNFCCPACIDEFKKDPQKYIKKIEEEKKGTEAEMEQQGHEGHPH
jgi:YHS domain-containing protein